jgi:hypothetical protein
LLSTVKMIESELLHIKSITPPNANNVEITTIHIAKQILPEIENALADEMPITEEKIVQVLQIDEADVEAELDEIKRNVEVRSTLSYQNRPQVKFDDINEIPTFANRQNEQSIEQSKELNDILTTANTPSLNETIGNTTNEINNSVIDASAKDLNDILAQNNMSANINTQSLVEKNIGENIDNVNEIIIPTPIIEIKKDNTAVVSQKELNEILPTNNAASLNDLHSKPINEVSDIFEDAPIKDLKKAIGVNERFLYLNELFRGDEAMYERSIKTINAFTIYPEAEFWIRRELKLKLGWDDKYNTVKQFDQLVRRRFL